ncbi:MAG: hypothetical protein RIQ82_1002 [Bacteroidota bacterium]
MSNANKLLRIAAKKVTDYIEMRQRQIADHREHGLDKLADLAEQDLQRRFGQWLSR